MKDSEIYLRAAELIASGDERFTCVAVAKACGKFNEWDSDKFVPAVSRYVKTYSRDSVSLQSKLGPAGYGDGKSIRVTALLFMAEIAKDSERKS